MAKTSKKFNCSEAEYNEVLALHFPHPGKELP